METIHAYHDKETDIDALHLKKEHSPSLHATVEAGGRGGGGETGKGGGNSAQLALKDETKGPEKTTGVSRAAVASVGAAARG